MHDLLSQGDLEGAKSLFQEAASIEPYCVEAIFNVGLVQLKLDDPEVGRAGAVLHHNTAMRP